MTDTNYGAHGRPPANWGFFLLISIGLGIVMAIIEWTLQQNVGWNPRANPELMFLINIGVLVVLTWLAGSSWLKKAGGTWDRQDRHRLAFAYTMVNLGMTLLGLLLIGSVLALGFSSGLGQELLDQAGLPPEVLTAGLVVIGVVVAIFLPLALWAGYGIMRLVLFFIVGKGETAPATADTFN